jgi:pyruvate,water dikinase
MFTVDPISKNKDTLVIEAAWGLGDYVVQGVVTPDHYEVSKSSQTILVKKIGHQTVMEVRSSEGVSSKSVDPKRQSAQKLPDLKILELAAIGSGIQNHYLAPQDIEWAYANSTLYITQARPITTLGEVQSQGSPTIALKALGASILKGAPASPGLVSGTVKVIMDINNLDQVQKGDILVTEMTTPDFVPAMKKASGIVTDRGGLTSHAAIVSRELGVPCVVGTEQATKLLSTGVIVTINGSTGEVFKGALPASQTQVIAPQDRQVEDSPTVTATKLYANLAEPELAEKIGKLHVDGIGLLRAEFMIAGIGVHPKKMIADGKSQEYIDRLATDIGTFCKAFSPRPVIYRATDFKTNEYKSLKGGQVYEPVESNPMLGFRGAYRYIKSPEVFALELEAIKIVRNKLGLTNLWLMIPFVSTVAEMTEVKKLVAGSGLYRTDSFKLFMMVEIPANVILLDDFLDVGLDGVSIGSNDLTMLVLGIDRDNSEVAPNFDERNPAVLWALEKTVRTCAKRGVMCGICGQAPSEYPELVEKLVEWGITSISVNPDRIAATRNIIAAAEHKLITSK